ncbi:8835_t:CDS:2 [Ambispora gerdemannii]|uniref:8835_t:CDS:1 n=1 Tax=Ambispora gerdemannii TaxID=144530 RepID=A0A9N9CQN2_9GLOM|nr:8835_t:CDS:2 [Ambispora gerdemannii]
MSGVNGGLDAPARPPNSNSGGKNTDTEMIQLESDRPYECDWTECGNVTDQPVNFDNYRRFTEIILRSHTEQSWTCQDCMSGMHKECKESIWYLLGTYQKL